jgi:hypothetical protein
VKDSIDLSDIASELGFEWCEIVRPRHRLPKGFVMIVDEEGLLKPNELNHVCSWFYESEKHGNPIVGNVMVLKEVMGDEGPELAGLDEDEINAVFDSIGKE